MTIDSIINCKRIEPLVAPSAFLVPISLVLSVIETSIIFITPIPPTKREIPAIMEMAIEMVSNISVMEDNILSILVTLI